MSLLHAKHKCASLNRMCCTELTGPTVAEGENGRVLKEQRGLQTPEIKQNNETIVAEYSCRWLSHRYREMPTRHTKTCIDSKVPESLSLVLRTCCEIMDLATECVEREA
eukprot:gnl/TRDRNA2_/TRDRNA2_205012_c0_seq1.p1 gnl/TRDRNA2_/TRDRNA2_205012_c0~~gnl/TRDRNA2_/TRDRNA2_205012_c0_seq1.p1  ORF type:complete len:109 (-),score=9.65 gnl/TRDRNA2_/TRDRNA2_205012_c0_seq1:153-479(-)